MSAPVLELADRLVAIVAEHMPAGIDEEAIGKIVEPHDENGIFDEELCRLVMSGRLAWRGHLNEDAPLTYRIPQPVHAEDLGALDAAVEQELRAVGDDGYSAHDLAGFLAVPFEAVSEAFQRLNRTGRVEQLDARPVEPRWRWTGPETQKQEGAEL